MKISLTTLAFALVIGCDETGVPNPDGANSKEPSPNANIVPAPLVAGTTLVSEQTQAATGTAELAGSAIPPPRPQPFALNRPPPADTQPARPIETIWLDGHFKWPSAGLPDPFIYGHANEASLSAQTQAQVTVLLRSHGRLLLQTRTAALPLAKDSQLRSRIDRFGHLLVWPEQERYRVLPKGSLRALFDEGRVDVTPMLNAEIQSLHSPNEARTRIRHRISSARGEIELNQVYTEGAGFGGMLLCRLLLEFASLRPGAPCGPNWVPNSAVLKDANRVVFEFKAITLGRRAGGMSNRFSVPPASGRFVQGGVPESRGAIFEPIQPSHPDNSLLLANYQPYLALARVNNTPVAYLPTNGQLRIRGLASNKVTVRFSSFFGHQLLAPTVINLPGSARAGAGPSPDAGLN